jgi:NAD(P)H-dependent FMN reductase
LPNVNKVMIVVGSVRPGRIGLPIAQWVRGQVEEHTDWDVDFADLADLDLPTMNEPNHPRLRQYTFDHTRAWSERVDAADAFIFVAPEYNHSFSSALKNALDYLSQEWWRKPVAFVSYGGVSAGTRGVSAMSPVLQSLGLVRTGANVELPFAGGQVQSGVFQAGEKESAIILKVLDELGPLADALRPLQNR